MNYTLQLHGERITYPVPPGLYELMSDIGREVLRDQPTTLYKYIADYLDTLLRVRQYTQTAGQVLDEIIDENKERMAYVQSLGVSWEEANSSAFKIQAAFHRYISRKELKRKLADKKREEAKTSMVSQSFKDYLLSLDSKKVNRASSLIQAIYRTYKARKQFLTMCKKISTHTIDDISPHLLLAQPSSGTTSKRDSKLLVYNQSPQGSVQSTWSMLQREIHQEDANGKRTSQLVCEEFANMKLRHSTTTKSTQYSVDGSTIEPNNKFLLPSYYDDTKPKVPMISETGQLVKDEEADIVTLFSTDSIDEDKLHHSNSLVEPPSLSKLSLSPNPELAKELFATIEKRSSKHSQFIQSDSKANNITKQVVHALNKELSKASVQAQRERGSFTKGSIIGAKSSNKSGSTEMKVDLIDEEPMPSI